ncbi:TPA: 16S rRNA (cytosine(1407)-C(5))-methyltransferase RsmF [Escherichia coli]|nr:16S rRNA (cytosine(1407)-C(5))-methyltransferase RsmF [Escherichia coli]
MAQHTVYFPDAFLTQMREAMPSTLSFDDFLAACQRPLRRSIRVNTLKTSVADFLQLTAPYGWTLTPIPWCEEGFWIERDNEDALPLGSTAEHLSGLFYIQEASSMLPVAALFADGNAPQRVMDVAAAPGSKTTQIAARMNNEGAILANEFSASRVKVLHANISRCGISNVALTHFDGRVFGAAVPEMFDAILLDAPCSGEGVVRKDPDALKNWSPESNQEIAATQRELIDSAFHALRPGGTLVYSTCTLNREENEAVCLACEAGQIRQAAASVGLNWDENLRLWQRDKELWLFPVGIEALIGKVRFSRLGIKLAETHNKGYRWQHEAVIALASPDNVNAFELTPQEAEEWYRGRDVYPHAAPVADDVLVTFQHQPIGLAKRIGSRLKNSYPRELVRDGKLFTGNA